LSCSPSSCSPVNLRPIAGIDIYDPSTWSVQVSLASNVFVLNNLERLLRSDRLNNSRQLVKDTLVVSRELQEQMKVYKKHIDRATVWLPECISSSTAAAESLPGGLQNPIGGLPRPSSLGVVDKYLLHSHLITRNDGDTQHLVVHTPRINTCSYTTYFGIPTSVHVFTWKGEMVLSFSFSEAKMGSVKD